MLFVETNHRRKSAISIHGSVVADVNQLHLRCPISQTFRRLQTVPESILLVEQAARTREEQAQNLKWGPMELGKPQADAPLSLIHAGV